MRAGASSWAVMYMLGDLRQHREYWFGGPPWESQEVLDNYWKDSPIAHVKNVRTPTLLHSVRLWRAFSLRLLRPR